MKFISLFFDKTNILNNAVRLKNTAIVKLLLENENINVNVPTI